MAWACSVPQLYSIFFNKFFQSQSLILTYKRACLYSQEYTEEIDAFSTHNHNWTQKIFSHNKGNRGLRGVPNPFSCWGRQKKSIAKELLFPLWQQQATKRELLTVWKCPIHEAPDLLSSQVFPRVEDRFNSLWNECNWRRLLSWRS